MGKAPRGILPLLVGLILAYTLLPGESWGEEGSPKKEDGPSALDQQKGAQKSEGRRKRLTRLVSPYATAEEILLPHEAVTLRRKFTTTEPRYFEGREVGEQAIFESLAREDEEKFYYAIKELEKPWWQDLIESLSGVVRYEEGLYTNYFNTRARNGLWTEKPFFGMRGSRWGVLRVDSNYFVSLERLSFEGKLKLHPHIVQTHGGQARFLYRPSRRFHILVFDTMQKSNKIRSADERISKVSIGNNAVSNRLASEFRYFLTARDVLVFNFDYDYSRANDAGALRITRGYRTKLSFLRAFTRRLILRGFWVYDYLRASNLGVKTAKIRHEPGVGFTFVLGRRLTTDVDYSKQYLHDKGLHKISRGNRVNFALNHRLTNQFTNSHILGYSQFEGKRSAISKIGTDPDTGQESKATFESLVMAEQFSYALTKLTSLTVTLEYMRTKAKGAKDNDRKRILVELIRPIIGNRANLTFTYIFDKNNGAIDTTYLSHTFLLAVSTKLGVGRKER